MASSALSLMSAPVMLHAARSNSFSAHEWLVNRIFGEISVVDAICFSFPRGMGAGLLTGTFVPFYDKAYPCCGLLSILSAAVCLATKFFHATLFSSLGCSK